MEAEPKISTYVEGKRKQNQITRSARDVRECFGSESAVALTGTLGTESNADSVRVVEACLAHCKIRLLRRVLIQRHKDGQAFVGAGTASNEEANVLLRVHLAP